MPPTTSYGSFASNCRDMGAELTLDAYVAAALGDYVGDYDVGGLALAFRAAVNDALAGTGVFLAGDEFYGPYPQDAGWETTIADAIESVDFWELAPQYGREG